MKPALPCVELLDVDVTSDDRVELDDVTLDDRVELDDVTAVDCVEPVMTSLTTA